MLPLVDSEGEQGQIGYHISEKRSSSDVTHKCLFLPIASLNHRGHLTVLNINILQVCFRNHASYEQETNQSGYPGQGRTQNFHSFMSF